MTKEEKKNLSKMTFSAVCAKWMTLHAGQWKPSTVSKYERILANHILPEFGDCLIEEIDMERIAVFSGKLTEEKKLASKTTRDILVFLHEILESTGRMVPFLYPKPEPADLRVLTEREQHVLTEYLCIGTDRYKLAVLLALTTGLRIGEICGLAWKHISLEEGTLTVQQTVQRIPNQDASMSSKTTLYLGTPKTVSSRRTLPLTPGILKLLGQFYEDNTDIFLITGTSRCADPRILQKKLHQYTRELKLQKVHFHTLRHTFATRCVEIGCDIKTLSEMLGHSDISLTMNLYVHPSLEHKRKNMERLVQAGFDCIR